MEHSYVVGRKDRYRWLDNRLRKTFGIVLVDRVGGVV